jgi:hypothetical protein
MGFTHNSTLAKNEPKWSAVDKPKLPNVAFADEKDRSYPHHWVDGGGSPDSKGRDTTGTMYLHKEGLNAAYSAAMGGHTGKKADAAIIAHLEAHRKALGLDKKQSAGKLSIPVAACRLMADVSIDDNGEGAKTAPIKILARSGEPVSHPDLEYPILHDFDTMQTPTKGRVPVDWCHDPAIPAFGFCNKFDTGDGQLLASGALVSTDPHDFAASLMNKSREGVPFQASIDWRGGNPEILMLAEGQTANFNGKERQGPMYIARNWPLSGIALCNHGVDENTSAQFAAGNTIELTVKPYITEQNSVSGGKVMSTAVETVETVAKDAVEAVVEVAEKAVETVETVAKEAVEVAEKAAEAVVDKVESVVSNKGQASGADDAIVDLPSVEAPTTTEAVKAVEVGKAQTLSVADGAKFLAAFGDKGGVWFAKGYSFEQAQAEHMQQLSQENADLKARLLATSGVEPVSFSVSDTKATPAPVSETTKQLTRAGVSGNVAALMQAIKIVRDK